MIRSARAIALIWAVISLLPLAAWSCFGTELRVGLGEKQTAMAAYATGFYVEEKTGIAPDFRPASDDPAAALKAETLDLYLAPASLPVPEGIVTREAGDIPGVGEMVYWIRPDVLEDLRFTTVERALRQMDTFFQSPVYRDAMKKSAAPKKAARKAVLNSD